MAGKERMVTPFVITSYSIHYTKLYEPVLRAGFTEVLVTGILIKWIRVSPKPIAIGANPWGARLSVAPRIMIKNIRVITTSVINAENNEYPRNNFV